MSKQSWWSSNGRPEIDPADDDKPTPGSRAKKKWPCKPNKGNHSFIVIDEERSAALRRRGYKKYKCSACSKIEFANDGEEPKQRK